MAYGVTTKRQIQFGQELYGTSGSAGAAGTAVAATAIWRGPGAQIDSGRAINRPSENVGLLIDTDRSYTPSMLAMLDIPETEATYEQICYPLEGGIKRIITGVADGAAAKVYDYTSGSANTVEPFTIEAGDNNAVSDMEYAVCTEFELTWSARDALRISSKWVGRQRTTGTAFAALTLPTVEEILAPTITITDGGTAIGTTAFSGTLIGYNLKLLTGIVPLFTATGQIYFDTIKYTKPTCTLGMTFEHDSNASTEYGKFVARTTRLVRILHLGSALSGSAYLFKRFMIDFSGLYTTFPPYDDKDGDNTVTVELQAGYNTTANLFARFLLVNALAAVT